MKNLAHYSLIIPLLAGLLSTPSQARTFKVCTFEHQGMLTKNGRGPQPFAEMYRAIIQHIEDQWGDKFTLEVLPVKRCEQAFRRGDFDIAAGYVIPTDLNLNRSLKNSTIAISSMPFLSGGNHIYTNINHAKINNIADLKDKVVGAVRGFDIPLSFTRRAKHKELREAPSLRQILIMLQRGRIDAALIQTGALSNVKKELLQRLHHGQTIEPWLASFQFQLNENGAILSNRFTLATMALIRAGSYNKIFAQHPYAIDFSTPETKDQRK